MLLSLKFCSIRAVQMDGFFETYIKWNFKLWGEKSLHAVSKAYNMSFKYYTTFCFKELNSYFSYYWIAKFKTALLILFDVVGWIKSAWNITLNFFISPQNQTKYLLPFLHKRLLLGKNIYQKYFKSFNHLLYFCIDTP